MISDHGGVGQGRWGKVGEPGERKLTRNKPEVRRWDKTNEDKLQNLRLEGGIKQMRIS